MQGLLARLLVHPLARGRDMDAPETTVLRRQIIRQKPLLRAVYESWYELFGAALPRGEGAVLELGAGGGLFKEYLPEVLRSDMLLLPDLDLACSGTALPFASGSLRAVVGCNVLHHIPDVRAFLHEASVCVRPGGKLLFLEPWVTPLSRLVYGHFHYEPFDPDMQQWKLPPAGPLSGANNALPWIVFARDRHALESEFADWRLQPLRFLGGFSYIFSGGVSMRSLLPGPLHGVARGLDRLATRCMPSLALFCFLELHRR